MDLDHSLGELEQLLEEETAALRALDRDAIDRIAATKVSLCERLTQANRPAVSPVGRESQIERIRHKALYNQVLLVHARDSVRGMLAIITGDSHGTGRPSAGEGHRLSVRV